jgi:hypothetical protein
LAEHTGSREAKRGVEYAARAGYVAKGIVYTTIGILAAMTAFGFSGGRIVGTRSALEVLRTQPFGQAILWAIAVGLVGYVIWRLFQAIADPEHKGNDPRGLAKRIGLAVSGLSYGALAVYTIARLTGNGGDGGAGDSGQQSAATIMQYRWGIWLVGLIGIVWLGVACYQAYRAYAVEFRKRWHASEMTGRMLQWSTRLSRFGIAARAISFACIGVFLVQAALQADPSEARGLDGALRSFSDEPYGAVWLGVIGLGFVCYGAYCALNARFRHINP